MIRRTELALHECTDVKGTTEQTIHVCKRDGGANKYDSEHGRPLTLGINVCTYGVC